MANHLHRQIREAVETLLTGLTTTGSRVYANRLQPMEDANLPGLRVFMDNEDVVDTSIHSPCIQERELDMFVESCAKANTTLDDTLDGSSKEVEVALASGITIGTHHLPCTYVGMQFDDALADKPVGVKRLRFRVSFAVMSNALDVLI
jgi:hypothetical protein